VPFTHREKKRLSRKQFLWHQPLPLALERMSRQHLDVLPVVDRADFHKLEGVVALVDVLDAYGVASVKSEPPGTSS
jgi:hypothetical protein